MREVKADHVDVGIVECYFPCDRECSRVWCGRGEWCESCGNIYPDYMFTEDKALYICPNCMED